MKETFAKDPFVMDNLHTIGAIFQLKLIFY